ncbi:MAG: hypothetical protein ACLQVX_00935 [Limisphaerales bacterium]
MKLLLLLALLVASIPLRPCAAATTQAAPATKVPNPKELAAIRNVVETLRGKKFLHDVPARDISEKELRALVDRDIAKDYPGRKLADLQELMVWLDLLPPNADLKTICEDLLVDQVAGLYDTETKTMCIPSTPVIATNRPPGKHPPPKNIEDLAGLDTEIVFAHEYTHALEDQYWPIDPPKDKESRASTDADTARTFLVEGSATRLMIEALPAEFDGRSPGTFAVAWNLLHSGLGEFAMNYVLSRAWKSPDVKVPGVPEALARTEAMPYSFGYTFCLAIMRDWGLDGLDYIYDHPPVSSKQVMHPKTSWEWRDLPVQVNLDETLPGGWKRLTDDTVGEAGIAALLGSQLKNLNCGLRLARGWKGDRAALYEATDGTRLLAWASSWDSPSAAGRFARACAEERKKVHQATLTTRPDRCLAWTRPDGTAGVVRCEGKRVLLLETDKPPALGEVEAGPGPATFTEPPQDAPRAAANTWLLRSNPLLSWRKDADYSVTKSFWGLLERHDHNSIGAADRILLGLVGEYRRTSSFSKWSLCWGLAAKHQSEARRGITRTTLLPWGILQSHFSSPVLQAPTNTLRRDTLLWGLAASRTSVDNGKQALRILPGGLLFRSTAAPGKSAVHVLGTGVSRTDTATRFRLLCIPLWTTHAATLTSRD